MKKITALTFKEAEQPITKLQSKFGGQPVWLEKAQWPQDVSGTPLAFVGQVMIDRNLFPDVQGQVAYLFFSTKEESETWDPDSGDNAVIIQPGTPRPSVKYAEQSTGPTLIDKEYEVELRTREEDYQVMPDLLDEEAYKAYFRQLSGNKIGGTPLFVQGEEYPKGFSRLLLQLDSTNLPFEIPFGDSGTGYLFINESATIGKFLWQCY
ncbi:MAG: DUF1963 domain-containing protein [Candidatus Berkiella sp.]